MSPIRGQRGIDDLGDVVINSSVKHLVPLLIDVADGAAGIG
jgi:hypothetical protein